MWERQKSAVDHFVADYDTTISPFLGCSIYVIIENFGHLI
jgi:hypothetical protein